MSKLILWFGFILSILLLSFALLGAQKVNPFAVALWVVILLGSGYKLFFARSK